jgi:NAD(P)H-hydrate epimerase
MALSIIAAMSDNQAGWPRSIYSTEQVRSFDRHAIEALGIAGFDLMRRAGRAALGFIESRWPEAESLAIYCGAGNNAGDGYVLAALARAAGFEVGVVAVVDPGALRGDAGRAFELARDAGVGIAAFVPGARVPDTDIGVPDTDIVVDALLGTGLARDVEGAIAEAVAAINAGGRPVLALDIPTGLDSDSGAIRGVAVAASATITFVGLKTGLYLGAGPACRGALGFADLELPPAVYEGARPRLRRLDAADRLGLLGPRGRGAHKGTHGRVLVVGGAEGMGGAARLAAEAALRAGAGLVYAAVAPSSLASVMAGRPEIMARGAAGPDEIKALAEGVDVIVVGPGLGRDAWGGALAGAMLALDKPLVIDADALSHLAAQRQRGRRWVLTPHPGEAARLLGVTTAEIQRARDEAVRTLARDFGAVAVLKGACSLVAQVDEKEEEPIAVCDHGNPGMATGGTGDVLAGLIGGLIAQFGFSRRVVEAAVLVHALAGDDAAADGERGLIASDLLPHIRRRVNPA